MSEPIKKQAEEIVSLNQELINFDLDDISVEALERRLEMAIADVVCGVFVCNTHGSCSAFGCGTYN
jgi:hypothetical protein